MIHFTYDRSNISNTQHKANTYEGKWLYIRQAL